MPIPTRFIFILLGPSAGSYPGQYHEVGRSIATLMSDEVSETTYIVEESEMVTEHGLR